MSDNENIEYEDFEEFNSYIDEEGPTFILGSEFKSSQVLYKMDKVAYKEAYEEYRNNLFEDNKNIIFAEFPSHIAVNFRKLYNGNHMVARERIGYLIDCSESLINFIFYLSICELRAREVKLIDLEYKNSDDNKNPNYKKLKAKDFFDDRLKLKLRILQSLVENNIFKDNNCYCTHLSINVIEVLIELHDLRNEISHSGTLSEEQYNSKFQIGYNKLNYIIPDIMFLKECKILKVIKCERGKVFCATFEGDSSVRNIVDYKFNNVFSGELLEAEEQVLFAKLKDKFIKLTPYMHCKTESEGHDSIICTFKKLSQGEFIFEHSKTKSEIKFDNLNATFEEERKSIKEIIGN